MKVRISATLMKLVPIDEVVDVPNTNPETIEEKAYELFTQTLAAGGGHPPMPIQGGEVTWEAA